METGLVSRFESLGDNCEFAFLQRRHGFESANVLRWSYVFDNKALIDLIERGFSGIHRFEDLTPRGGGDMVDDVPRGIAFHSALRSRPEGREWRFVDPEGERRRIHAAESEKIAYLVEKTLGAFRAADRVFVYKNNTGVSDEDARAILGALRTYNRRNALLFLGLPESGLPAGAVVELQDGLFKGRLDRYAPYSKADDVSEAAWLRVLRKTLELASGEAAAAADHGLATAGVG